MLVFGDFAAWLAGRLIDLLFHAYRQQVVLGAAIAGFSATGLGLIIGSYLVAGWWQPALLGFGTSLLIVGTVELGILGVLKKIIEPDEGPSEMIKVLTEWLNHPDVVRRLQYQRTGMEPAAVAAALRDLATNLDASAEGGNGENTD